MNIITRGTNSTLIFTLEEKRTLSIPYFLVRMTSRSGRNLKRFILPSDQSASVARYNKFTVTETDSAEILTSGTVTLKPTGFWDYEIYEQLSSTNLAEALATNAKPIETGVMLVKSPATADTYFNEVSGTTNKFYGQ